VPFFARKKVLLTQLLTQIYFITVALMRCITQMQEGLNYLHCCVLVCWQNLWRLVKEKSPAAYAAGTFHVYEPV